MISAHSLAILIRRGTQFACFKNRRANVSKDSKLAVLSIIAVFIVSEAAAQRQANSEQRDNPALGVWEAPIGHRQPDGADVPTDILQYESVVSPATR
jgi:hypothetical protein